MCSQTGNDIWRNDLATALRVVSALRNVKFDADIVGSVAEHGYSKHDIDITVPFWLTEEERATENIENPTLWHGVQQYRAVMCGLGFELAVANDNGEGNETWVKGNAVVDLFPVIMNP